MPDEPTNDTPSDPSATEEVPAPETATATAEPPVTEDSVVVEDEPEQQQQPKRPKKISAQSLTAPALQRHATNKGDARALYWFGALLQVGGSPNPFTAYTIGGVTFHQRMATITHITDRETETNFKVGQVTELRASQVRQILKDIRRLIVRVSKRGGEIHNAETKGYQPQDIDKPIANFIYFAKTDSREEFITRVGAAAKADGKAVPTVVPALSETFTSDKDLLPTEG